MGRIFLLALVGLTLLSIAGIGNAADWRPYAVHEFFLSYYDAESITHPSENIVRVWVKWDYTEEGVMNKVREFGKFENLSYEINLIEINCVERKCQIVLSNLYNKEGGIIYSTDFPGLPVTGLIVPESDVDDLYQKVCR